MPDIIHPDRRIDTAPAKLVNGSNARRVKRNKRKSASNKKILPLLGPILGHVVSESSACRFQFLEKGNELGMEQLDLFSISLGLENDSTGAEVHAGHFNAGLGDPATVTNGNVPGDSHCFVIVEEAFLFFQPTLYNYDLVLSYLGLTLLGSEFDSQLQTGISYGLASINCLAHDGAEDLKFEPRSIMAGFPQSKTRQVGDPPLNVVQAMIAPEKAGRCDTLEFEIGSEGEPCASRTQETFSVRIMRNEEVIHPCPIPAPIRSGPGKFIRRKLSAALSRLARVFSNVSAELSRLVAPFAGKRVQIAQPPVRAFALRIERRHSVGSVGKLLNRIASHCKGLKENKEGLQVTEYRRFDSGPSHSYETRIRCRTSAGNSIKRRLRSLLIVRANWRPWV